jgi:hypothetical protein
MIVGLNWKLVRARAIHHHEGFFSDLQEAIGPESQKGRENRPGVVG